MDDKKNWLKSSVSPDQVSNTIKGIVVALSGVLIMVGKMFELPFTETNIAEFAQQLAMAGGSLWFLYGLMMKGVMRLGKK